MQLIPHQELGVGELPRCCESCWYGQANASSPERVLDVSIPPVWRSPRALLASAWKEMIFFLPLKLFAYLLSFLEVLKIVTKLLLLQNEIQPVVEHFAVWATFPAWG